MRWVPICPGLPNAPTPSIKACRIPDSGWPVAYLSLPPPTPLMPPRPTCQLLPLHLDQETNLRARHGRIHTGDEHYCMCDLQGHGNLHVSTYDWLDVTSSHPATNTSNTLIPLAQWCRGRAPCTA